MYTTNNSNVERSLLMEENKELTLCLMNNTFSATDLELTRRCFRPDLLWGSHDRNMREAIGEIGALSEKSSFSEVFAVLILARMGYLRVRPLVF